MCDFSEQFRSTRLLCRWSPDGLYIAAAEGTKCVIRDVESLEIVVVFTCLDNIDRVVWSPHSDFVACAVLKRGFTQVWSLEDAEWTCKIDEGPAGLSSIRWAPDGTHLVSVAAHNLRIQIWSLEDSTSCYIADPKHGEPAGITFSSDGEYLAFLERRDSHDFVNIVATAGWQHTTRFKVETTDAARVLWAPSSRALCVVDSNIHYLVTLYGLDGTLIQRYSAYENALGVKSAAWAPSSQFVAAGSYDSKARILNALSLKPVMECAHVHDVALPAASNVDPAVVYVETHIQHNVGVATKFNIAKLPVTLPSERVEKRGNPKVGVGLVKWSPDSRYVATADASMPKVLMIWDVHLLQLVAVVQLLDAVVQAEWQPCHTPRLALVSAQNRVFFWSLESCSSVSIPTTHAGFSPGQIKWSPQGENLMVVAKEGFVLCAVGDMGPTDGA